MRPTKTLIGAQARRAVLAGVKAIYDPVSVTLGPEGKNVLIYRTMNRGPRITNDGKTVASVQNPKNIFIRQAAETFRELCLLTDLKVGDGTTTTAVVGGKLFFNGYEYLNSAKGAFQENNSKGVITLKKKIFETAEKVKEQIKKKAKPIKNLKELERLAFVSCEDEEIGKLVAGMAWSVGPDGFIDVLESNKYEIETELLQGMRFPARIPDKRFLKLDPENEKKLQVHLQKTKVLLTNYGIGGEVPGVEKFITREKLVEQIQPLIKENKKIVIIAPGFTKDALTDIQSANIVIVQHPNGKQEQALSGVKLIPVKVPSLRTEQFEDLAVYFGARFIDSFKDDFIVKDSDLGFTETLIIKDEDIREDAVAAGGAGTIQQESGEGQPESNGKALSSTKSPVQQRVDVLKGQLKETKGEAFQNLMKRRIGSLSSGVGVIKVGAATQAESLYLKLKIEDTVNACKSALKEGYVRGGGVCLKEIADTLPDNDLMKTAIAHPYELITKSLGGNAEIAEDVIDTMESVYYAVEHGAQVAAQLLTVDVVTPEVDDPVYGEGEYAIARELKNIANVYRKRFGQEQEGIEDAANEMYGGMTEDEYIFTNQD